MNIKIILSAIAGFVFGISATLSVVNFRHNMTPPTPVEVSALNGGTALLGVSQQLDMMSEKVGKLNAMVQGCGHLMVGVRDSVRALEMKLADDEQIPGAGGSDGFSMYQPITVPPSTVASYLTQEKIAELMARQPKPAVQEPVEEDLPSPAQEALFEELAGKLQDPDYRDSLTMQGILRDGSTLTRAQNRELVRLVTELLTQNEIDPVHFYGYAGSPIEKIIEKAKQ